MIHRKIRSLQSLGVLVGSLPFLQSCIMVLNFNRVNLDVKIYRMHGAQMCFSQITIKALIVKYVLI